MSDAAAEYLCDRVGYFERTDDVVLSEDEYSVDDGTGDETPALDDKTYDELRDLATEAEIDGRGSMNKDELIDALRDQE